MDQSGLGTRLKAAREVKGLSLRALASKVGVSPSLLSQIENSKTNPSVDTLYALVRQLEISVDYLLGHIAKTPPKSAQPEPSERFVLQSAAENPTLEMENGVRWERLAVLPGLDMEALRVTYQPGASSSIEGKPMRHLGYEHIAMVSGELRVQHESNIFLLRAGDSMAFDSRWPHLFENQSSKPAIGVWHMIGRSGQSDAAATDEAELLTASGGRLNSAVDVLRSFREI